MIEHCEQAIQAEQADHEETNRDVDGSLLRDEHGELFFPPQTPAGLRKASRWGRSSDEDETEIPRLPPQVFESIVSKFPQLKSVLTVLEKSQAPFAWIGEKVKEMEQEKPLPPPRKAFVFPKKKEEEKRVTLSAVKQAELGSIKHAEKQNRVDQSARPLLTPQVQHRAIPQHQQTQSWIDQRAQTFSTPQAKHRDVPQHQPTPPDNLLPSEVPGSSGPPNLTHSAQSRHLQDMALSVLEEANCAIAESRQLLSASSFPSNPQDPSRLANAPSLTAPRDSQGGTQSTPHKEGPVFLSGEHTPSALLSNVPESSPFVNTPYFAQAQDFQASTYRSPYTGHPLDPHVQNASLDHTTTSNLPGGSRAAFAPLTHSKRLREPENPLHSSSQPRRRVRFLSPERPSHEFPSSIEPDSSRLIDEPFFTPYHNSGYPTSNLAQAHHNVPPPSRELNSFDNLHSSTASNRSAFLNTPYMAQRDNLDPPVRVLAGPSDRLTIWVLDDRSTIPYPWAQPHDPRGLPPPPGQLSRSAVPATPASDAIDSWVAFHYQRLASIPPSIRNLPANSGFLQNGVVTRVTMSRPPSDNDTYANVPGPLYGRPSAARRPTRSAFTRVNTVIPAPSSLARAANRGGHNLAPAANTLPHQSSSAALPPSHASLPSSQGSFGVQQPVQSSNVSTSGQPSFLEAANRRGETPLAHAISHQPSSPATPTSTAISAPPAQPGFGVLFSPATAGNAARSLRARGPGSRRTSRRNDSSPSPLADPPQTPSRRAPSGQVISPSPLQQESGPESSSRQASHGTSQASPSSTARRGGNRVTKSSASPSSSDIFSRALQASMQQASKQYRGGNRSLAASTQRLQSLVGTSGTFDVWTASEHPLVAAAPSTTTTAALDQTPPAPAPSTTAQPRSHAASTHQQSTIGTTGDRTQTDRTVGDRTAQPTSSAAGTQAPAAPASQAESNTKAQARQALGPLAAYLEQAQALGPPHARSAPQARHASTTTAGARDDAGGAREGAVAGAEDAGGATRRAAAADRYA